MRINVLGTPAPQGSKRHVGHGVMIESSKKVKPWRQDVKYAALDAMGPSPGDIPPIEGPVNIDVVFYLTRPRSHYGTGRNADQIRDNAPKVPARKPDIDKLLRSTFDALGEAGVFVDDAQITDVTMRKRFADDRPPGATIDVRFALCSTCWEPMDTPGCSTSPESKERYPHGFHTVSGGVAQAAS